MNRTRPASGRPPVADPRRIGVFVRLTADELAAIDAARLTAGLTRAAFVRAGAVELAERLTDQPTATKETTMATISFNLGNRRFTYSPVASVPDGVRFDTPARFQGQIVTYSFGSATPSRDESSAGDMWLRVYDASDKSTAYYRRTRTTTRKARALAAAGE